MIHENNTKKINFAIINQSHTKGFDRRTVLGALNSNKEFIGVITVTIDEVNLASINIRERARSLIGILHWNEM